MIVGWPTEFYGETFWPYRNAKRGFCKVQERVVMAEVPVLWNLRRTRTVKLIPPRLELLSVLMT